MDLSFYEFGAKLALHDSGLEKLALGRSRQYLHEQVYRRLAPGAQLPPSMQDYVRGLRSSDLGGWDKELARQKGMIQREVAARGQPMAMSNTRQLRENLQNQLARRQAISQSIASGAVSPRDAAKQMAAVEKQIAKVRAPVQKAIANRVPIVAAPLVSAPAAAAPASVAAKGGGFLRGIGRFAGRHPLLSALAAATAAGVGTYAATRPKPVQQDFWWE